MANQFNWQTQEIDATVAFTKDDGSPGTVQAGSIVWAVTGTGLTVTPAADGMSAVIGGTANGVGTVTVDADGDLGSGVQAIHLESDAIVSSDIDIEATGGTVTIGAPRPKS
jgi:hypothetical protein